MGQFHSKPETYLERIRAEVPRYDELQEQAIAAIPFSPERVLELGMGTGETTRRLIEAYPDAWVIGLDASADIYPYIRNGIGLGSFLHPRHYARGEEAFLEHTSTDPGQTSEDGSFTVVEAECLAGCGFPTCVQINSRYFENVNPEDVPQILEQLRGEGR